MVRNARARAKRKGVPCTITPDDIVIPDRCPVLGIPLESLQGKRGGHDASPSLDRLDPDRGYVPGNVEVVSLKANAMKQAASPHDLYLVACYYLRKEVQWPPE